MSTPSLSGWFTGWVVELTGDFFVFPALLVGEMEDIEDDEPSYELPGPDITWRDTSIARSKLPGADEEGAWAGISLTLSTLSEIIGGRRKAIQYNNWHKDAKGRDNGIASREYDFVFVPGNTGFQGGDRL